MRALSAAEREAVHQTLNSERFADQAPREVYATLLDEGTYLCSPRTMYRVLSEHAEVRERRDQLRHPAYAKPELLATGPNQVWSWDITQLLGPMKWVYYYLYVMLDIFSRYVVGWLIAERESSSLAELLIAEACAKQHIAPDQLTIHADNGGPMIAKPVTLLMADLGVQPSHSRPHVSNDNPFSEAQFKTLKYQPDYPERFGSPLDARTWAPTFFPWYNDEHHHRGIGFLELERGPFALVAVVACAEPYHRARVVESPLLVARCRVPAALELAKHGRRLRAAPRLLAAACGRA